MSRRQAMRVSGAGLTGLSLRLRPEPLLAHAQQAPQPVPDKLVETPVRNIAQLPLLPDGSAPEYTPREAGTISEPTLWRYTKGQPPLIEFDYRKMKVKVDARGTAKRSGTLTFADLEPLPRHSFVVLLQCGAPNPRGIVKWTGVRFADFANMLGVQAFAHYCRIVSSDQYWIEEDMKTMLHPQVILAWMLNDEPIPPKHGAPLRLIIPFRYGARSIKAITEIYFTSTSFPMPAVQVRGASTLHFQGPVSRESGQEALGS
ncbi:MAG: molybdopterin-dependent oxidoreductase [Acidobacteria bacterium]|nr:molybdopterin-dependent oxidoreductase [Acidobacteriota bacterium]